MYNGNDGCQKVVMNDASKDKHGVLWNYEDKQLKYFSNGICQGKCE